MVCAFSAPSGTGPLPLRPIVLLDLHLTLLQVVINESATAAARAARRPAGGRGAADRARILRLQRRQRRLAAGRAGRLPPLAAAASSAFAALVLLPPAPAAGSAPNSASVTTAQPSTRTPRLAGFFQPSWACSPRRTPSAMFHMVSGAERRAGRGRWRARGRTARIRARRALQRRVIDQEGVRVVVGHGRPARVRADRPAAAAARRAGRQFDDFRIAVEQRQQGFLVRFHQPRQRSRTRPPSS